MQNMTKNFSGPSSLSHRRVNLLGGAAPRVMVAILILGMTDTRANRGCTATGAWTRRAREVGAAACQASDRQFQELRIVTCDEVVVIVAAGGEILATAGAAGEIHRGQTVIIRPATTMTEIAVHLVIITTTAIDARLAIITGTDIHPATDTILPTDTTSDRWRSGTEMMLNQSGERAEVAGGLFPGATAKIAWEALVQKREAQEEESCQFPDVGLEWRIGFQTGERKTQRRRAFSVPTLKLDLTTTIFLFPSFELTTQAWMT